MEQRLNMKQLLAKVEEVAIHEPDMLMLFIAECTAVLAMNQIPSEEMAYFEQQANHIVDRYVTFDMLDANVSKGNGFIH